MFPPGRVRIGAVSMDSYGSEGARSLYVGIDAPVGASGVTRRWLVVDEAALEVLSDYIQTLISFNREQKETH